MSKKKRKQLFSPEESPKNHLILRNITPLTHNQEITFQKFQEGYHLLLTGSAGTGKTFCALYLALKQLLHPDNTYDKIVIVRSAVPSRDMGFLPGSPAQKAEVFEEPYRAMCADLFGRGDAYEILKSKAMIKFTTTSFLRGLTLDNCILILDESQNTDFAESDTVLSRVGDNCKVIVCGDHKQTDLERKKEVSGFAKMVQVLESIRSVQHVVFTREDVVRSGFVKDYIFAKENCGY